jgi:hypothetical protein
VSNTGSTITDLSAEGRNAFQLSLSFYKAEKDLYDTERDALDKLQTWMTKTVAPRYMETCFEYSETVRVWYENLKKQVGTNEHTIKREIKDTYKHAIKPLTKTPKDIEAWIANWEQVMAKGFDREILFAKDVDEWFNDFLNAVNSLEPLWTKAYRLTKSDEVEKGTLSYRTLANDFRKAVLASRTDAKPSRVAKGSFGLTFLDNMLKRRRTRLTPALRRCRGGSDKVTSVHPTPRKPWPLGRENGGIPGHFCRPVVSAVLVNKIITSGPVSIFFRIRHLKGSNPKA